MATRSSFWVKRHAGSLAEFFLTDANVDEAEARRQISAELGQEPASLQTLPYPPVDLPPSDRFPHGMPGFCYTPGQCAGRTSCPKARACTE